jgi:hypothetical protein
MPSRSALKIFTKQSWAVYQGVSQLTEHLKSSTYSKLTTQHNSKKPRLTEKFAELISILSSTFNLSWRCGSLEKSKFYFWCSVHCKNPSGDWGWCQMSCSTSTRPCLTNMSLTLDSRATKANLVAVSILVLATRIESNESAEDGFS